MAGPPTANGSSRAPLARSILGEGSRVVLAHGFTQTGRLWGSMLPGLAENHQVVSVDMPGHAGSSTVVADLNEGARLLGTTGGRATYVGYSMGARFCLHLALDRPDLVRSLVLISGTAGIDQPEERAARRADDEVLANELDPRDGSRANDASPEDGQARVDAFLERWLEGPLFVGLGPQARATEERRRNTGPGLASSLRLAGTGTQLPLWDRLAELAMPVLVLNGARDAKFSELGRRLVDSIGTNARQVLVPDAGHAPHLQNPGLVTRLVHALASSSQPQGSASQPQGS